MSEGLKASHKRLHMPAVVLCCGTELVVVLFPQNPLQTGELVVTGNSGRGWSWEVLVYGIVVESFG